MNLQKKYDDCYRESLEIGFVRNGEKCEGEQLRPYVTNGKCYYCPHYKGGYSNDN